MCLCLQSGTSFTASRLPRPVVIRYHLTDNTPIPRWRCSQAMSKTEILLILLVLVILIVGIWFIFSDQIWVLVSYLETLIYPDIVTPE